MPSSAPGLTLRDFTLRVLVTIGLVVPALQPGNCAGLLLTFWRSSSSRLRPGAGRRLERLG
jgi:hypothetical protein